ncbi:hypothetical protein [Sphingobacterium thalpophilum]|uniref:hypothetical protein n=1 Tax=Sphingobacterium thalpophilum TaxID=259 RepID=UPI0024A6C5B8|nr:hypothetical protein [Sphingobacterium thalpophilum]
MYKSLQVKLDTFHEVCSKQSELRIALAPFYQKEFYTLYNEIKVTLRSPYLLFFLDDENLDSLHEFKGDLPDRFSFRMCPKFKNSESTADYYQSRYLFFTVEIDKDRLEIYSVNNKRDGKGHSFEETEDKILLAVIKPSQYNIDKIRSILVKFLIEELEFLTETFAVEANGELNYDRTYATEGNEIYQI